MKDLLKSTSVERFRDTIAKKHGMIYCKGPEGEELECRTLREAEERTGVPHNSIQYALKHSGKSRKGWRFERNGTDQS